MAQSLSLLWSDLMIWTIIIISAILLFAFSVWVIFFRTALKSIMQSPKLRSYQFKLNQQDTEEEKRQRHDERTEIPVVSVILPARNEQDNIQKCLGSLLQQDYQNYEIIAVNDCSTDATEEILHKLAAASNSENTV